jgi:hypothetical protein
VKPNRDLQRVLRDTPLPGEGEAEERAWNVVRTAYAERTPMPGSSRGRRLALALAAGVGLLAIGLSPAGARVEDLVSDVVGIGEEDAKPALRSLPAAGELLVESDLGPWIVREDGSRRLLGAYGQATWSPRGLFVAATDGRELVAVDPTGQVRWTITAPGLVRDPRWSPSGFRIAYRSGDDLRVVAGDGTDDRLIARDVAPVAPAWRPIGDSKLAAAPGDAGSHVLTYVDDDKHVRTVDVDTGRTVRTTRRDFELLSAPPAGTNSGRAISPDGRHLARIHYRRGREQLALLRDGGHEPHVLFSTPGRLTGPTWSPDGNWLLIGLPDADQWLFIRTDQPGRVIAFDSISEQFDPGGRGEARFPRVAGWILPQR